MHIRDISISFDDSCWPTVLWRLKFRANDSCLTSHGSQLASQHQSRTWISCAAAVPLLDDSDEGGPSCDMLGVLPPAFSLEAVKPWSWKLLAGQPGPNRVAKVLLNPIQNGGEIRQISCFPVASEAKKQNSKKQKNKKMAYDGPPLLS